MTTTTVAQHTTQPLNFGPEWFVKISLYKICLTYFFFSTYKGFEHYQHLIQPLRFHLQVAVVAEIFLNFLQQNIVIQKMKS
jgi:hypothetical protein